MPKIIIVTVNLTYFTCRYVEPVDVEQIVVFVPINWIIVGVKPGVLAITYQVYLLTIYNIKNYIKTLIRLNINKFFFSRKYFKLKLKFKLSEKIIFIYIKIEIMNFIKSGHVIWLIV